MRRRLHGTIALTGVARSGQVALSWTASTGATAYNVYRGTVFDGEATTPIATVTSPSFTDTSVTNGTLYFYEVAATNSVGISGDTNQITMTPMATGGTSGATSISCGGGAAAPFVADTDFGSGTTSSTKPRSDSRGAAPLGSDARGRGVRPVPGVRAVPCDDRSAAGAPRPHQLPHRAAGWQRAHVHARSQRHAVRHPAARRARAVPRRARAVPELLLGPRPRQRIRLRRVSPRLRAQWQVLHFGWSEREGPFVFKRGGDPCLLFPLPPDDAQFGFVYPVIVSTTTGRRTSRARPTPDTRSAAVTCIADRSPPCTASTSSAISSMAGSCSRPSTAG